MRPEIIREHQKGYPEEQQAVKGDSSLKVWLFF